MKLITALTILTTTSASLPPIPLDEHGDYNGSDLISWITSHPQGYVHPSVRIGRAIPGDPTSMMGLYVKSDGVAIEEDEIIARIPWSHLIGPDEYEKWNFSFSCSEIRNLATELQKGENSHYGPYIRYLLAQPRGTIPGEWSKPAKKFYSKLLNYGDLPPYEEQWLDNYETQWVKGCNGSYDTYEKMAYYLASSRDEDALMVPIYDMANHSNDVEKLNTLSFKPEKEGRSFRFEASKRIEPGQEIYNSYNRCNPCSDANFKLCETFSSQPTPDMFAHFGFVEAFPQYWRFDSTEEDEEDDEIQLCLDENNGEMEVMWHEGGMPDDEDFEFLNRHLKRLREMYDNKEVLEKKWVLVEGEENVKKMSRLEWDMIWGYYEELVRAMDAAVRYVPDEDDKDEL